MGVWLNYHSMIGECSPNIIIVSQSILMMSSKVGVLAFSSLVLWDRHSCTTVWTDGVYTLFSPFIFFMHCLRSAFRASITIVTIFPVWVNPIARCNWDDVVYNTCLYTILYQRYWDTTSFI